MLNQVDFGDIRRLAGEGHRISAIAEAFEVSTMRIYQILKDPPEPGEVEAVNEARRLFEAQRDADQPRACGFIGDDAGLVADLFDIPTDGGDATHDADGLPRR